MDCPEPESHSKSQHNLSVSLSNSSPCKNSRLNKTKQIVIAIKCKSKQKSTHKSKHKSKQKSLSCSNIKQPEQKLKSTNTRLKTLQQSNSISMKQLRKQQIVSYDKKIRNQNKKYISRENSSQNLQMRLPWGTDEPRLNNYVLNTLAKMQKVKKMNVQKKEQTFNTERSEQFKEADIKLQLTPKKIPENQEVSVKYSKKVPDKIVKSPTYNEEQKTNKKIRQTKKEKLVSEQKKTEKQCKKAEQPEEPTTQKAKVRRMSELLSKSLTGQFQCLEKNNFYSLNFRVVNRKILEIEMAFAKKVEDFTVNLNKGSLECQSINETYQNVSPKSSIILMTAVSGIQKAQTFIYPELQIILNQKGGSFGLQKKITLPYNQLFLLQTLTSEQLKHIKLPSKIKNKSVIQQIPYCKQILLRMQRIFGNNFTKFKIKEHLFYLYGFRYLGEMSLIRVVVNGNKCILECQSSSGSNTKEVLEMFLPVLGI